MRRCKDRRVVGENPRACVADLIPVRRGPPPPPPPPQQAPQQAPQPSARRAFWVYSHGGRSDEMDELLAKYRAVGLRGRSARTRSGSTHDEGAFAQDCVVCYEHLCAWGVPRDGFVGVRAHVPRLDIATTSRCRLSGAPLHAECRRGGPSAELRGFLDDHYLVSKRICGACILCHHSVNVQMHPAIRKGGFFGEHAPGDVNQILTSSYCVGCNAFLHDDCHAAWHIGTADRAWPVSERVVWWDFASRCALLSPSAHEETGLPATVCEDDAGWYWGGGGDAPPLLPAERAFVDECRQRGAVHSFVRMKGGAGQCMLCARTMVEQGLSMEHFARASVSDARARLLDVWTYSRCVECDVPLHARCAVQYHTRLYPASPRVLEYVVAEQHLAAPLPAAAQCALCTATLDGMFPWSSTAGVLDVGARVVCPGCAGTPLCHACFRDQHHPAPGARACSSRVLSFFDAHAASPPGVPGAGGTCRLCEHTLECLRAEASDEERPMLTTQRAAADHVLYPIAAGCGVCGVVLCRECTLVWHHRCARGAAFLLPTSSSMRAWVHRQKTLLRYGEAASGRGGGHSEPRVRGGGGSDSDSDDTVSCGAPAASCCELDFGGEDAGAGPA